MNRLNRNSRRLRRALRGVNRMRSRLTNLVKTTDDAMKSNQTDRNRLEIEHGILEKQHGQATRVLERLDALTE